MIGPTKPPINVQDGFFYQLRKDNTLVEVMLLSEKKRVGRIRRFDKYALVLEVEGREEMIYKHAISSVTSLGGSPAASAAAPVRDARGLTRRLLLVFVPVAAALTACAPPPRPVDLSSPEARAAALATRAEGEAAEGRLRDALDGYREAARLVPEDDRYRDRVVQLRAAFVTSLRDEAEPALQRGDIPSARRAALALVEVDPDSPAGYHVLASAAEAEGKLEDAWAAARTAHERAPADAALTESLAALAMRTARFAEADALYGDLAKSDPAMVDKQAAARMEFQVQNLPPLARKAVAVPRVTRAQLATLLVTLVPEVASARVPPGADVATDILDRPERNALVKAIALGFFSVSRETHYVGADVPVPRSEMPAHLRRVAALHGDPEDECLVGPAALATCGILPETASRQVSGREAFAAIDATLRLAR